MHKHNLSEVGKYANHHTTRKLSKRNSTQSAACRGTAGGHLSFYEIIISRGKPPHWPGYHIIVWDSVTVYKSCWK